VSDQFFGKTLLWRNKVNLVKHAL